MVCSDAHLHVDASKYNRSLTDAHEPVVEGNTQDTCTKVFPFSASQHFSSATFEREIMRFLIIHLTDAVKDFT